MRLKINFPEVALENLPETCSLDVADRGEQTLDSVGRFVNLTRERIRQIERRVLGDLKGPLRRATR